MRWLLAILLSILLMPVSSIAWEIPYGVQDPMHSPGYPACGGGEIGYWQVISLNSSDGTKQKIYLAITIIDFMDPATVICYVPHDRRIQIMEPEKQL